MNMVAKPVRRLQDAVAFSLPGTTAEPRTVIRWGYGHGPIRSDV